MKPLVYTLALIVFIWLADWLWFHYWYTFGKLATRRI